MRSLILTLFICCVATRQSEGLTVDNWSTPFPPNPGLPNTGQRIIWIGPVCDGFQCPPDPWGQNSFGSFAIQEDVPGTLGLADRVAVLGGLATQPTIARINESVGRVEISAGQVKAHSLEFHWGAWAPGHEWNLDLIALGIESVSFDIRGESGALLPTHIYVQLFSGDLRAEEPFAFVNRYVSESSRITIPLAEFVPYSEFSFEDVDGMYIVVSPCPFGCAPSGAYRYSLGPITLESSSTPSDQDSWGRLKDRYR